jgi:hypothetical protein
MVKVPQYVYAYYWNGYKVGMNSIIASGSY